MAVTITRSIWVDDDGTGTTGTVINQALHTTLYNEIDTALAKVAQLAGGNAFTGNQSVAGVLSVTGFGTHGFVGTGAGLNILAARNTAAGTGNGAQLMLGNDTDPALTLIRSSASNWSADSFPAAGSVIYGAGSGGISLAAAAGAIRLYAGGASLERARILSTGEVCINTTASQTGQLTIVTDQAHTGFIIQNSSPANGLSMVFFLNSAAGACGSITQTGATSVAYNTTSDARLKTDPGRAVDLASLRAVVVHDFTWIADNVRDRGVFAQEAHALYPRAVTEGTDETTDDGVTLARPWMTDYSKFVPDLIVGWQQHDAEIAELRAMFAAAKG